MDLESGRLKRKASFLIITLNTTEIINNRSVG